MDMVFLNGRFIAHDDATISIKDRGFLYSDSIYETLPIEQGRCLALPDRLHRLHSNLTHLGIEMPHTPDEWQRILSELIQHNEAQSGRYYIYLHVTRGTSPTRQLNIPSACTPTVLAFMGQVTPEQTQHYQRGFKVITVEDNRRRDRFIKATGLLPNIMAFNQAQEQSIDDIIYQHQGYALESSSSNLFIVEKDRLITPPANYQIINGITRQTVIELAKSLDIECEERLMTLDELRNADEIWLTASNKDIVPVIELNKQRIGNGKAGPFWHRLNDALREYKMTHSTLLTPPPSGEEPMTDNHENSSPLEFPCEFFVKIIMKNSDSSKEKVTAIIQRHFDQFDTDALSLRPSKNDNYLAFTAKLQVPEKAPLDALYKDLSDEPEVLMAL
ncbi:MAG TPA: hypothetical protein DCL40_05015 [Coxiellaceae bacterium]|nr:hypothetical protein [Coxiellaceae bacterium]